MLGAPLLFAIELARPVRRRFLRDGPPRWVFRDSVEAGVSLGRLAFYLLVFPGVVLHEGAHYLACLLTGTKVIPLRTVLAGQSRTVGRLMLGYVRHERARLPH